jgi:hypothetical protein
MDIIKTALNYMIRRGQVFIHLGKRREMQTILS